MTRAARVVTTAMTTTVRGVVCAGVNQKVLTVTDEPTQDGNEPTSGQHYFHVTQPCDECASGQRRLAYAMVGVGVGLGIIVTWTVLRNG